MLAVDDASALGLCYSCTIPSIYETEQVQWEERYVIICHTKKQHRNYNLCGSA